MNDQKIQHSRLIYDAIKLEVRDEKDANFKETLSSAEHKVLMYLYEHRASLVSKYKLEEVGWGGRPVSVSSLSVLLFSLRKKLSRFEDILIKNVPSEGYILIIETMETRKADEKAPDEKAPEEKMEVKISADRHRTDLMVLAIFAFTFSILFVVYEALITPFYCEIYGTTQYCYIATPSSEARSKAILAKDEGLFIYTTPGMNEFHYEKIILP